MATTMGYTAADREFLLAAAQACADCAGAIDDDSLEDWPGYFTEDCLYRVETREGRANGWQIGLMHCEGRGMLRDRVLAIRHGNVFDPHTYRHVLSMPRFAPAQKGGDGTEFASARRVLTSFNVTRVMKTGETTLFAVGTYDDAFVETEGRLLIHRRTVILDSRNLDTLLVIPL
jgi:3-phenylpropionate/cinnamic acid dioxygenase small subunit